MLSDAAACGFASAGLRVEDCGVVPTGCIATYVTEKKLNGAILITGSHMPHDRIGVIAMMSDGAYVPDRVARALEGMYEQYESRRCMTPPDRIGSILPADCPVELYRKSLLSAVEVKLIARQRPRVLVDPCNGAACGVLTDVLRRAGCIVLEVNGTPSPVPGRAPEPRAHSLIVTAHEVVKKGCDLGVATDIDADRVLFIDSRGQVLSEDLVGAIFAESELTPLRQRRCVTPINSSGLIDHVCAELNATLEYCPPGQPATVEVIKKTGAHYSYEESGKYYFCREVLWCDGLLASLKMLEIMAHRKKPLHEVGAHLPRFYQVKRFVRCPEDRKEATMLHVAEIWRKEATEGRARDVTVDGLKRIYRDSSWLLIRKSGTEPLIRVFSDSISFDRSEALVEIGEDIVRRAMRGRGNATSRRSGE
jgi:phosphomannomutase/phosphoglucomutase